VTGVIAGAALREIGRRRGLLVMFVLLPLSFYLARRDLQGQSIRLLALGMGWSVATLGLFTASSGGSAHAVDERLRLAGYQVRHLVAGRVLATLGCGGVVATGYYLVTILDQDVRHSWAVAAMFAATVAIAAPLGIMLATVLPRELEGTLGLMMVMGLQMLVDPASALAKLLPLWATRSIGTFAIDGTAAASPW
jgi:hypothetical protein